MSKLIAVIDDEFETEYIYNLIFEKFIREEKVSLQFFQSSMKFLDWIQANSPSLILTDINMPEITGVEVVRKLKEAGRCIPTYFLSGHDEDEYRPLMRELGVNRYFMKPLNFQLLLNYMESDLKFVTVNL